MQKDDVFPVCGKWVLNAYLLQKEPPDSGVQLVVKRAYEDYMMKTTRSFSDNRESHMINTILMNGGLKELETRYYIV